MSKGHFEAKKHAYRQTQDGVVVSFVIHPSDVPADLATAALGTVYMIGFAAMGDVTGLPSKDGPAAPMRKADEPSSPSPKERKRWGDLAPSARAALMTKDPAFWEYSSLVSAGCARATNETEADAILKAICKVGSKRDLDNPDNWSSLGILQQLEGNFRAWQQHKGHAA